MTCKRTKGQLIAAALRRRPMTYMQMWSLGFSSCPWKRAKEGLRDGEQIKKGTTRDGLVTWQVVAVK